MTVRKLFLAIFAFFLVTALTTTTIAAQGLWPDEGYAESIQSAASGDVNAAAHVTNVNTNNYSDLIRRILGPIPGITVVSMSSPIAKQMLAQSAIYNISSYIVAMYMNPPASTYAFVQDVGQTLGFVPKKAYAQGLGFSALSSLLPLWKVFRNIAYGLLAIIMMVIGFFVMFRKKIDPKTVVTVQSALPKIVITLLLITFSYAIVGIMIDLMYLTIYIIVSLFTVGLPGAFASQNILNDYLNGGISQVFSVLYGGTNASDELAKLISSSADIQGITSAILWLLISLGAVFVFVRMFVMLLMAYIQIIISLLLAPLQFLLEAIPGGKGFSSWFKNFISNLLVFPVTAGMLLIGTILLHLGETPGVLWTPPFLNTMDTQSGSITALLGMGVLMAIPSIVHSIQAALKAKPLVGMDMGLGGTVGTATQMLSLGYYLKGMIPSNLMKDTNKPPTPQPK